MTSSITESTNPSPVMTVLYDGACPLCRREIGIYRDLQPLKLDSPVCFADISDLSVQLPPGTTREQLLARFHIQDRDEKLLSGAEAFLALWGNLPSWRWLALFGRLPGATWMMERIYLFFRLRLNMQCLASRIDTSSKVM